MRAASNGDRSENADYQYGKRRLRQIDGRIRFLAKRIEAAGSGGPGSCESGAGGDEGILRGDGALCQCRGAERVVSIVGTDEIDLKRNHISWVYPLGRALTRSAAGDSVVLEAPGGTESLTVLEVRYERISVEPFREPPGSTASASGTPLGEDHLRKKRRSRGRVVKKNKSGFGQVGGVQAKRMPLPFLAVVYETI